MEFKLIKEKGPVNENVKVPFIINLIGSGFFVGHAPIASGTIGSLVGLAIYLIPHFSEFIYITLSVLIFFFVGIYCSDKMIARYGEDAPQIVIDEIVGLWFTYLVGSIVFELFFSFKSFDPEFQFTAKLSFALIGFIMFRFFDIFKIEPAKYFDEKNSGFGVMMDDIASGLYAGISSAVFTHLAWYQFLRKLLG
jgi:phosphatidylglycerophosphatase A